MSRGSLRQVHEVRVMEFDNEHDKRTLAARGGEVSDLSETSPRRLGEVSGKSRTSRGSRGQVCDKSETSPRRLRLVSGKFRGSRGRLGEVSGKFV